VSTRVGTKGQVTIEKEIRDTLGIRPGWRAIQRLEGKRLVIEFLPPKHRRSLAGILTDATTIRAATEAELQAATEEAWDEGARD
jgi:AbrB family looped-hinge helix DNA binding protein